MKDSKLDAERLAALLDGRLGERERAEILAELASSDDAYEAYIDALAVTRELEGRDTGGDSGTTPAVLPLRKPPRYRPRGLWIVLAAAALTGVAVLPWLRSTTPRGPAGDGVVALLDGNALPPQWDGTPWATTRGSSADLDDASRAARLGARLVDYELAERARDPRATEIAGEVATLLDAVPRGPIVAPLFRRASEDAAVVPLDSLPSLLARGRAVARGANESYYVLGAWTEAARVAAAHGDAVFFRNEVEGAAIDRALASPDVEPQVRTLTERVRAATASQVAPDWASIRRNLDELLAEVGSRHGGLPSL